LFQGVAVTVVVQNDDVWSERGCLSDGLVRVSFCDGETSLAEVGKMRVHVVAVMNKQARGGGRIGAVMGDTSNAERVSGPWMPLGIEVANGRGLVRAGVGPNRP
jgi:hypothetical protein